ncbi:MAG: transketolase C-terminal domain-containing protein [archaeon]
MTSFPIDLSQYEPVVLDLKQDTLSPEQKTKLEKNIELCRDAIIFFTAHAGARGLGGHTGGAFDIVPEALILEGFMQGENDVFSTHFDEAGHRVAWQYLLMALRKHIPQEQLLKYREFKGKLPGHPERGLTPGLDFSSGRLGHLWSYVNGVAAANPDKRVAMLGSDGSQQEGNDAEGARYAVAQKLNVTLLIDDNDVTIAGHPSDYMHGYDVAKTLEGHGIPVQIVDSTAQCDLDGRYQAIRKALLADGPSAVIMRRKMAPGVPNIEGTPKGHDVIDTESAIIYLEKRGHKEAVNIIKATKKVDTKTTYLGSSEEKKKNRDEFGKIINGVLDGMSEEDRKESVLVVDSDLEGSCGLHHIRKAHPEVYVTGGIMERGNYSVAAGFGSEPGKQGIFGTFSAFLEMIVSEITMARLNQANVMAHFSHVGIDEMTDNTCHFGTNIFFADDGIPEKDTTRLYFPADAGQMKAAVERIFNDSGLRFVFSTRSAVPFILDEKGQPLYGKDYEFEPGKDEVIREGTAGYIVSYGEMLYRSLDAVERLKKEGIGVGLINKPTLNVKDDAMLKRLSEAPFVLVTETQNEKTGLGIRFGTWLLGQGFCGKYAHMGTHLLGEGGLAEHIPYQGLSPDDIIKKVKDLAK